jgi:hypothetical protein
VLVVAPWNYPYLCSVNAVVPALLAATRWSSRCPRRPPSGGPLGRGPGGRGAARRRVPLRGCGPRRRCEDRGRSPGPLRGPHRGQRQAAIGHVCSPPCRAAGGSRALCRHRIGAGRKTTPPTCARTPRSRQPWPSWSTVCTSTRVSRAAQSSASTCTATGSESWYRRSSLRLALRPGQPARRRHHARASRAPGRDGVRARSVTDAVAKGARALIDPVAFPGDRPGTPYLAPQVLIDVDHGIRVMTEESFGPVVGIMPVDGDDHAVALMNDRVFGLTASIWTARRRFRAGRRRPSRDQDVVPQQLRLPRPGAGVDGRQALGPVRLAVDARLLERDPAQVVPPEAGAVTDIGALRATCAPCRSYVDGSVASRPRPTRTARLGSSSGPPRRGVPMPGSKRPLGSVSGGGGDRAGGGPAWWGARRPDPGGTPRRPPARPATAAVGHGR